MVRSQAGESLTIGRLAESAGVGVETVRFYQRKGLLAVPPAGSGIRRYGDGELRRLRFIRQAQAAGFTLAEIAELLTLDESQDRERARMLARSRIESLNEKIAELERSRDCLRRLARECGDGSTGPCPILTAFDARKPGKQR